MITLLLVVLVLLASLLELWALEVPGRGRAEARDLADESACRMSL
jgi:hypothetical protein